MPDPPRLAVVAVALRRNQPGGNGVEMAMTCRRIHAADYKSITVTRSREDGRDERSRTVSGPRQVRKLIALYNRLHGAPDVQTGCPESGPSTIEYRLTFHPADAAPRVVLSPTNCFVVGVTIGGHPEPDLYPAAAVGAAASRVLR